VDQYGEHYFVDITSISALGNMVSVVIQKKTYRYEKSPSYALVGAMPPKDYIEQEYILLTGDVNSVGELKKEIAGETLVTFTNDLKNWTVVPVVGGDYFYYLITGHGEMECYIHRVDDNILVEKLVSDDEVFGIHSMNYIFIYYFNNNKLIRYDVDAGVKEVLPDTAYKYIKKERDELLDSTRIKNVVFVGTNEGYNMLFDLILDKKVGEFFVPNDEVVWDVSRVTGELVILSMLDREVVLRDNYGGTIAKINLDEIGFEGRDWFWDDKGAKVYFFGFENEGSKRDAKGLIRGLIWDYVTGETKKINWGFDGENAYVQ
jgi:hypothetical protein